MSEELKTLIECRRMLADRSDAKWRDRIMAGVYDETWTMKLIVAAFNRGQALRKAHARD